MKETLKNLREQNNYSQAIIAKYLNISRQMYIKYESGEAEPPVRVIKQLSFLYKVTYAQIIDNSFDEQNYEAQKKATKEMVVSEATPAYGAAVSQGNYFDLAQSLLSKLNIFEQLKLLSQLADLIGKNGVNKIVEKKSKTSPEYHPLKTMSKDELNKNFEEYSGFLKGVVVDDPKAQRHNKSQETLLSELESLKGITKDCKYNSIEEARAERINERLGGKF